jgi:hypothetical protein
VKCKELRVCEEAHNVADCTTCSFSNGVESCAVCKENFLLRRGKCRTVSKFVECLSLEESKRADVPAFCNMCYQTTTDTNKYMCATCDKAYEYKHTSGSDSCDLITSCPLG